MVTKVLLVIRGAPGAGKSTIAECLVASNLFHKYFEADMYFSKDGKYEYEPKQLYQAHSWCQGQVERAMIDGKNVIVSNTFCQENHINPYKALAKQYDYVVQYMYLDGPFESIHGVPEETIIRMKKQLHDSMVSAGHRCL